MEDTFTSEEVKDMVSGLCAVVNGEMETELIHTSHTHSLLVAQLLQQAETWHLNMKVDISALENKLVHLPLSLSLSPFYIYIHFLNPQRASRDAGTV